MIKATTKHVALFLLVMLLTVGFAVTTVAQNTLYGDNIVINGDFSADTLGPWADETGVNGTASVTAGELAITGIQDVPNIYDAQVNQPFTADQIAVLAAGGTFELTFDARASTAEKDIHVFLGEVGGSWARYWAPDGDGLITITNTTQTYTLTHDVTQTWDAMRLGFEVSSDTASIFIDNVVLRKVDDNVLYDGGIVIGEDSLSAAWTQIGTGQATFSADNGAVKISEFMNIVNSYDVQFVQELDTAQVDSIYAGPYIMSFDARTEAESKIVQAFFGNNGTDGDWTNFAPQVTLDNTMKSYTLNIDVSQNWTGMKIGFEVSADNSAVWFDNIVVSRVREIKPDAPAFALAADGATVTVTVTPQAGATDYDVYFNDTAIDSVDQAGNTLIGTLNTETGLSMTHSTSAPHSSLAADFSAHYAVVAKTESGTESDLTASMVTAGMTVAPNYAVQLSLDAVDAVFTALETETMPDAATLAGFFPDTYTPFSINSENKTIENGTGGDNDADISGKFWVGFDSEDDLLVIYAEVMDDSMVFASEAIGSGGAWNFDSWEMGLANYEPASFIQGSTHENFEGGTEPDWQFRGGLMSGRAPFIHANGGGNSFDGEIPSSQSIGEKTATGWRLLSMITTIELAGGVSEDKAFDFPEANEIGLYPFQVTLNDNDATARDTQIGWSPKGGQDDWWNTPARWITVAFVGADMVVSNEDGVNGDQPVKFSLDQNYPNPFNPTTNISFTLANSSNVTLEVFNMLGQKVATLLKGDKMTAGQHTQAFDASSLASGMYLYRLSTPSFVQSRKMMLIK